MSLVLTRPDPQGKHNGNLAISSLRQAKRRSLAQQLELSNRLELSQPASSKDNIVRDFHEDVDQKCFFWPREIWGCTTNTTDGQKPSGDVYELLWDPRQCRA